MIIISKYIIETDDTTANTIEKLYDTNDLHTLMDEENLWPEDMEVVNTGVGFRWQNEIEFNEAKVLSEGLADMIEGMRVFSKERGHEIDDLQLYLESIDQLQSINDEENM